MTTRDWQQFAASGELMVEAAILALRGAAKNESRLYKFPARVPSLYNWVLGSARRECDDYYGGVSSGDFWKVFVR